ncbi:hypothetical protein OC846_006216 [Tilletia horrida]|uniref:DUF1754-domain-containing protein n=1 Tax=Tilletia horrida TaxID=155126 RepID=A0AAN6GM16_9BASI|nr:hypothetical protein OC845_006213 [Tilletia horrida]KAK0543995.1 hypothetical protein OC846_006216 [Tilletia horrida]KAK0560241.1 hypothetical protein OC861_006349 [Tilletia horrida]
MGEDAYRFKPGGSLKFKGPSGDKKKKKSKSSTGAKVRDEGVSASHASGSGSSRAVSSSSKAVAGLDDEQDGFASSSLPAAPGKTDAERRFDEIQRKRLSDKIKSEAKKSHKDKVEKFNTYLENLSEHYDIPKVGPG